MSTKLGTLTLDLVAKTSNFINPVKDVEKQTKSSFESMGKKVTAFGAVAVSAITAVGASAYTMAREYSNAAAELQTFAFISNATTQEFQAMSVGAETAGISAEKLSDQFKDFNEKLGEFITIGSGGAVDFFEQIATKTEGSAEGARKLALEMQNLSGPKALQLYVDKLEEAGVTQQQMSFYLESMASDTTNLIPLLKNGGEGFKFWADAAEKAGIIMDESAIQKAAELKVQLGLLDLQIAGVKNQFIQGLMPSLVSVGDAMSQGAVNTNLMTQAGEDLGDVFKGVAVVGMGVYVVIKNLSNAISGLVADAIIAKQKMNLAAEDQGFFANLPGVKFAKSLLVTTTLASSGNSYTGQALKENRETAEDFKKFISTTYSDATNASVKAQAKLAQSQIGVIKGSDEWIKKQNEAAKASSGLNKELQKQNRLMDEQKRNREQISKTYSSDFQNMIWDEEEQSELVKKSGFSAEEQAKYLDLVKKRFDTENAEYFKSLNLEINAHKWSEEEKLNYSHKMDKEILQNSVKVANEIRDAKIKAIDEQYAIELQKARFHAFNTRQALQDSISGLSAGSDDIFAKATMSPREYEKWALENERSNSQVSLKQNRVAVEQDIMTSTAYSSEDDRYEDLLKAHQEYRDAMAAIDVKYAQQEQDLQKTQWLNQATVWSNMLSQGQTTFSQLAQTVKDSSGEQSSAYQRMFKMQKAFSIASAMVNTFMAISQTWSDATLPYWAKIAGSVVAGAAGAAQVAAISQQSIQGMAHNGIDNIPTEGTWLLDGGERVLNPQQNKDLTSYLANKQGGSGVTIYVENSGTPKEFEAQQIDENTVRLIARDEVTKNAGKVVSKQLSNSNSDMSKSMRRNFKVQQNRAQGV